MTVKAVRKEMDMNGQAPMAQGQQQPANTQVPPPQMQGQAEIPDHTHPEYDQMMVKLQEIEGQLQSQAPGGINQELADEDDMGNKQPMKMESYIRKMIKEELKGVPERETGKKLNGSGPDNTSDIPQTNQPANGEAPSGGNFDSDDKTNKEDGDDTINKAPKTGSEFDKLPIQKNKMNQAKALIEKAKALMREANGDDPTTPNPGEVKKEPAKMDGSVPNKSPMGGTEELGGASADPEANVPNDKRPKLKEADGEEPEDLNKIQTETINKVYAQLKREMANESNTHRESFVGLTSNSNSQLEASQAEYLDTKTAVTNTMKEYLTKAGHSRALGFMVPPATF